MFSMPAIRNSLIFNLLLILFRRGFAILTRMESPALPLGRRSKHHESHRFACSLETANANTPETVYNNQDVYFLNLFRNAPVGASFGSGWPKGSVPPAGPSFIVRTPLRSLPRAKSKGRQRTSGTAVPTLRGACRYCKRLFRVERRIRRMSGPSAWCGHRNAQENTSFNTTPDGFQLFSISAFSFSASHRHFVLLKNNEKYFILLVVTHAH
jgi:hypothetical protein